MLIETTLRSRYTRIAANNRGQKTADNLLESLADLAKTTRYSQLSVAMVTDRAGVSTTLFWRYFDDLNDAIRHLAASPYRHQPSVRRLVRFLLEEDEAMGVATR